MACNFTPRGTRLNKEWDALTAGSMAHTASGMLLGGSVGFVDALTIIRMIGEYLVAPLPGGTFAAGDNCRVAIGIGVFSTDVVLAGAGSLPDPSSEAAYPWLFWKEHQFVFQLATPDGDEIDSTVRVAFDIRSMRKIKPQETLAFVSQYVDVGGTPPMTVFASATRVLVAGK